MNNIVNTFINDFSNQNFSEQNIISKQIINFLVNEKNSVLFEEIEKFLLEYINDFKKDIFDYDEYANISTDEKKQIVQTLNNELNYESFYFVSNKLNYECKIEFEVRFKNFYYCYNYSGNIEYEGKTDYYYIFEENNISSQNIKLLEKLFYVDHIGEKCSLWKYKYKQINLSDE